MKAAGFVNYGTDLDNPDFAGHCPSDRAVRSDRGTSVTSSKGSCVQPSTHDGPAVVDVHVARQELSIPPKITLEQAKGFGLFAMRTILSGEGDQIVEVAKTNLRQLALE